MDGLELLTEQHVEVMHLFDKLERHEGEVDAKSSIFEQIADDLAVHMTLEEELVYPVAYSAEEEEPLRQALHEHQTIKRMLVDLMGLDRESPKFDATLEILKEELMHHVRNEESVLFAAARRRLGDPALEALGAQMKAQFQRRIKQSPGREIRARPEQGRSHP